MLPNGNSVADADGITGVVHVTESIVLMDVLTYLNFPTT